MVAPRRHLTVVTCSAGDHFSQDVAIQGSVVVVGAAMTNGIANYDESWDAAVAPYRKALIAEPSPLDRQVGAGVLDFVHHRCVMRMVKQVAEERLGVDRGVVCL